MENKILAKVNGKEIKQSDVHMLYQNLGPNAQQYAGEEGYKKLVEQLVLEEMLQSEASALNLQDSEEYKSQLENLKKSLLAQYFVSTIMNSVEVEEEEMKKFFEDNKANFQKPNTVKASHILVDTEEKAKEILAEVNNGLEFGEAAMKYSSCPSKNAGGSLGEFGKGQMVKEFEDAVFSMEIGAVSEPVKTQFGFHIIRLDELNEARELSFDEAKATIESQLKYQKQSQAYADKQSELKEKYPVEYLY